MYIQPLNYLDTRDKVVQQMYGHLKYRHLTFEQKLEVVGKTHDIQKKYMIEQKKKLTLS
jgi:hypothetical protein